LSDWWTMDALRPLCGEGKAVGHYYGPDPKAPQIAFLAVKQGDTTRSAVRYKSAAQITYDLKELIAPEGAEKLSFPELEGAIYEGWVVLFHNEANSAAGAVFFKLEADRSYKILVTGLAPGRWEIWRDGWREEHTALVHPSAGATQLDGPKGTYFLRRSQ
jgi:hypothetical protein